MLLSALLENPREWRYGYEISRQTGLKSGTLYPLLMRLSDQGLLEEAWREPQLPGRPARHVYRLTAGGLQLAHDLTRPASRPGVEPRGVQAEAGT